MKAGLLSGGPAFIVSEDGLSEKHLPGSPAEHDYPRDHGSDDKNRATPQRCEQAAKRTGAWFGN
jgi:hypothetical protein